MICCQSIWYADKWREAMVANILQLRQLNVCHILKMLIVIHQNLNAEELFARTVIGI